MVNGPINIGHVFGVEAEANANRLGLVAAICQRTVLRLATAARRHAKERA